jgi:L-threonylcarbamoyladenylate synthase
MSRIYVPAAASPADPTVARAGALLRAGELVAFPTETVYGLGASGLDAAAVGKIFAAKGRPSTHPLILHVASIDAAWALAREVTPRARALAAAFWPGPLTLVLPRAAHVPLAVTGGGDTVGIRIPHGALTLALLQSAGIPVAAPSANRYQQISPTTAAHVHAGLGDAVSMIVDGGPCAYGLESTVVDGVTGAVLRPGPITLAQLQAVDARIMYTARTQSAGVHAAPGLDAKHYAPKAKLHCVTTAMLGALDTDARGSAGVLAFEAQAGFRFACVTPREPAAYGHALFAALHAADRVECTEIYVEMPPISSDWAAVNDRLLRAAG